MDAVGGGVSFPQGSGSMGVAHIPGDSLTPMSTGVRVELVQLSGLFGELDEVTLGAGYWGLGRS